MIALTALAMKGDEERIRAAGCDGYIAKPLAYQEFLAIIAELVDGAMIAESRHHRPSGPRADRRRRAPQPAAASK